MAGKTEKAGPSMDRGARSGSRRIDAAPWQRQPNLSACLRLVGASHSSRFLLNIIVPDLPTGTAATDKTDMKYKKDSESTKSEYKF